MKISHLEKIQARRLALLAAAGMLLICRTPGVCRDPDPGCCAELTASATAVPQEAFTVFSKAADCFFKSDKFDEACACFREAGKQKKTAAVADYFCALARYRQLRYLEDQQVWEEYFGRGSEYRGQITGGLNKAITLSAAAEPVAVYANLLLWQFHKDQEDDFTERALESLMAVVNAYGAQAADPGPIKDAADTLAAYGEKAKARQVYAVYIDAVLKAGIKPEELKAMGQAFLREQNLDLAESVFNAYIRKLKNDAPKDSVIAELAELAQAFSFKDEGCKDAAYAEQIFRALEDVGGAEAFSEDLLFLRAYNLEKQKDFTSAKDVYVLLLKNYPQAKQAARITLKAALLCAYAAGDLAGAREYFTRLAEKEPDSAESLAGLYHLGLLSQWEDDLEAAQGYYTKLVKKAGAGFTQTVSLARARLKEIEQKQLLDNRLRLFLNAALGQGNGGMPASHTELRASLYRPKQGQKVEIAADAYPPQSGCMPVSLEYLWLGDLGNADPAVDQSGFTTSFDEPGVKMVGVVVTVPSGMLGRAFDMLDVE